MTVAFARPPIPADVAAKRLDEAAGQPSITAARALDTLARHPDRNISARARWALRAIKGDKA